MKQCIFCSIINHDIATSFVAETDTLVVIKDIAPKAPVHLLIIPKYHVRDIASLHDHDKQIMGEMALMAHNLSQELSTKDFRLIINNGAFQHVPHVHMHFLAGSTISEF